MRKFKNQNSNVKNKKVKNKKERKKKNHNILKISIGYNRDLKKCQKSDF